MIVSNSCLHWVNDLEGTLRAYRESLIPDGVFLGSSFGGDSLQELRICLNLAESERDGGVSPTVSPMLSLTDMGNIFSRSGHFNLPTVDVTHMQYEFTSTYQLFDFIRSIGE
jgi:NADH dehydrogenase [ubiquinone] 1 alpha subcomplex assembly factor 5